ncbi:hypothetical protein Micbo1qcDRAFT_202021 [Microdochium bolleyi]|uniref:HMG box domain-containing protein n=1 Tax=Microdochium bolleyi TaxID=196109 RepID=A0A136JA98_9PEZI|nr:hypothetical protein Micbo1qcDRAFT_202021 [Microdochium bolleyi]
MQPSFPSGGGAFSDNGGCSGGFSPPNQIPSMPQPGAAPSSHQPFELALNQNLVRLLREWQYCQQLPRPVVDIVCIPTSIYDSWTAQAKILVRQLHGASTRKDVVYCFDSYIAGRMYIGALMDFISAGYWIHQEPGSSMPAVGLVHQQSRLPVPSQQSSVGTQSTRDPMEPLPGTAAMSPSSSAQVPPQPAAEASHQNASTSAGSSWPQNTTRPAEQGTSRKRAIIALSDIQDSTSAQVSTERPDKKAKKTKVPRPANAWILYRRAQRPDFAKQHPGASEGELSTFISAAWRAESTEVRTYWKQKEKEERDEHKQKHPDYKYAPTAPKQKGTKPARKSRLASAPSALNTGLVTSDSNQDPAKEFVKRQQTASTEATGYADKHTIPVASGSTPIVAEILDIAPFSPSIVFQFSPQSTDAFETAYPVAAAQEPTNQVLSEPACQETLNLEYIEAFLKINPTTDFEVKPILGASDSGPTVESATDSVDPASINATTPTDARGQGILGECWLKDSIFANTILESNESSALADANSTTVVADSSNACVMSPLAAVASSDPVKSSSAFDTDEFFNMDVFAAHPPTGLLGDHHTEPVDFDFIFDDCLSGNLQV